ncbi:hypothetical protein KKA15_05895 [Patescibacteria group bacterium]|nr:hypothetical protein [Patescibacteria group bacterium]
MPRVRGRYRWYVVIKLSNSISQKEKGKIMSQVPDDWIVDINPDSLL